MSERSNDPAAPPADATGGTGNGLYDDPLAYDVLHGPGTSDEVTGLEAIATRFASSGPWLEPACGTGRLLRAAARRGKRVAGFDTNPAMIDFARERLDRLPDARHHRVFVADMESFMGDDVPPGSIGFAFNTINTIRHLMSDGALHAHLSQTARALRPGGAYVVGLSTAAYAWEQPSEDVWEGGRGPLRVMQVVNYDPPTQDERIERVYSHLMLTRPSGVEHVDGAYHLRSYSLEEWTGAIDRSAMTIEAVVDESGVECEPAEGWYRLFVLRPR
jgi:SAM-dependent methyltransferase